MTLEILGLLGLAVLAGIALLFYKLRNLGKALSHQTAKIDRHIDAALKDKVSEIENTIAIGALGLRFPIFFGGASIDGFHARYLIQHLVASPPKFIMELGSGSSTILLAHTMKLLAADEYKHVSIDHESYFLEITKRYAALNGVADAVEFVHCPLEKAGPSGEEWYAHVPETLGGKKIDLLIIDGPPAYGKGLELARAPALDILYPHLAERCTIVLDDANRPGETQVAEQWIKKYPDLRMTKLPQGKGLAILTRAQS
jgi:predicted O-methyltransferase YrrM